MRESQFFKIKNLAFYGLENESRETFLNKLKPFIYAKSAARWLGENNYFAWPENLKLNVYENLELASLRITKNIFKKSVTIETVLRGKFGIWCQQQSRHNPDSISENPLISTPVGCWWFDDGGLIFKEAPFSEGVLLIKIDEASNAEMSLGQKILPAEPMANFVKIIAALRRLVVPVKNADFDRSLQELTIVTSGAAKLIFSLHFDPTDNLSGLEEILKNNRLESIDYINLTVENKIYLKAK